MVGGEEELDESFSKPHIVLYHSFNNKIESDDDDECHLKVCYVNLIKINI